MIELALRRALHSAYAEPDKRGPRLNVKVPSVPAATAATAAT